MDSGFHERLKEIEAAFEETERRLSDQDVLADQVRYTELTKRHAELRPVVEGFHAYQGALEDAREAEELAGVESDPDMTADLRAMASERRHEAERIGAELRRSLIPKDPNDDKDVIVEVRSAAGGDEAAIWAGDLLGMYRAYADRLGYKTEILESSPSETGGVKEVIFAIKGTGAYSRMKFEAGVHRVQRVPKTESQGRIHTSTATVAVLPEAEEVEVELDPNEVRVDVYRSSGPGGQSVNTTDSAVRLTHEPTGLVVSCQDEKSQLQNKEKAFRILRARLYQMQHEEYLGEIADARRSQVGTGGRSEKIRTYNFKENRVTDHRIGMTVKQLPEILAGDLDTFIDALTGEDEARKLVEGD
ncbi:MAG: peptide chain release factor 1 [Acidimicrobiia bacterium]